MGIVDVSEQRSEKFDSVFQRIRDEVIVHMTSTMPMEAVEWFRRVCCSKQRFNDLSFTLTAVDGRQNIDYNVPDGKLNNIMSVVDFVEILRGRPLSDDEYFHAVLLEWCIRLVSLRFLPLNCQPIERN